MTQEVGSGYRLTFTPPTKNRALSAYLSGTVCAGGLTGSLFGAVEGWRDPMGSYGWNYRCQEVLVHTLGWGLGGLVAGPLFPVLALGWWLTKDDKPLNE